MKWSREPTDHSFTNSPTIKKNSNTWYQKHLEWYSPLCTGTSISFLLTPAVYLSKAFTVPLAPLLQCQPPSLVEPIYNCRPPIAVCQMPASDIVHHCAGVSGANCHLFFPVLLLRKRSEKHRNTFGEQRYGRSCQLVLEIIRAYTCWEACNISVVREAMLRENLKIKVIVECVSVCIVIPYVLL